MVRWVFLEDYSIYTFQCDISMSGSRSIPLTFHKCSSVSSNLILNWSVVVLELSLFWYMAIAWLVKSLEKLIFGYSIQQIFSTGNHLYLRVNRNFAPVTITHIVSQKQGLGRKKNRKTSSCTWEILIWLSQYIPSQITSSFLMVKGLQCFKSFSGE